MRAVGQHSCLFRPEALSLEGTSTILYNFASFSLAMFSYKPVYMPYLVLPSTIYALFYEILWVVSSRYSWGAVPLSVQCPIFGD